MILATYLCNTTTWIENEKLFTTAAEELPRFQLLALAVQRSPQTASLCCKTIRTLRITENMALAVGRFEFLIVPTRSAKRK